jgi:hypothetical protein
MKFLKHYKVLLILFLLLTCYLSFTTATLTDYGTTWDEFDNVNSGNFYEKAIVKKDLKIVDTQPNPERYPPFVNTSISFFADLTKNVLPNLKYIERVHLGIVLISSIGILSIFAFLKIYTKSYIYAIIGAVFMATYPRYYGDIHNNIKDIPMMSLFCLTMLTGMLSVKEKSYKYSILTALLIGISFATKFNAIFIPIILFAWIFAINIKNIKYFKEEKLFKFPSMRLDLLLIPFGGLIFSIIFWPYLWTNTAERVSKVLYYFSSIWRGGTVLFNGQLYQSGINLPWYYAPQYLAIVTPISLIILFLVGLVAIFKTKSEERQWLLLPVFWLVLTLARYLTSSTVVYDGIRHFWEAVPAMVIISVYGLYFFTNKIKLPNPNRTILVKAIVTFGVFMIVTIEGLRAIIQLHPYQTAYYNELVGSTYGAQGKYDIEYWGNFYKEAFEWVEANGKGNKVTLLLDVDPIRYQNYLQPSISVTDARESPYRYVAIQNRQSINSKYIMLLKEKYTLAHTITRKGADIGYIFEREEGVENIFK